MTEVFPQAQFGEGRNDRPSAERSVPADGPPAWEKTTPQGIEAGGKDRRPGGAW